MTADLRKALLGIAAQRNVDGSCSWCRWGDNDHAPYCPTAEARAALGLPCDRVPPLGAYIDATAPEPAPVAEGLDAIADGVRYAGGNGTSDYWRGFNDGIDRLCAALEPAAASPSPESE